MQVIPTDPQNLSQFKSTYSCVLSGNILFGLVICDHWRPSIQMQRNTPLGCHYLFSLRCALCYVFCLASLSSQSNSTLSVFRSCKLFPAQGSRMLVLQTIGYPRPEASALSFYVGRQACTCMNCCAHKSGCVHKIAGNLTAAVRLNFDVR